MADRKNSSQDRPGRCEGRCRYAEDIGADGYSCSDGCAYEWKAEWKAKGWEEAIVYTDEELHPSFFKEGNDGPVQRS